MAPTRIPAERFAPFRRFNRSRSWRCPVAAAFAGWAAGGGLEYAAWRNVTLKLGYLHVDLGSQHVQLVVQAPATGNATASAHFENAFDLVRASVNLRF